jgi:hypothetical protein
MNKALLASLLDIWNTVLARAGGPTMLPGESKVGEAVGADWRCDIESFESTVEPINKALSASP